MNGEPRSSEPGVVGRELSCPPSLKTWSKKDDVRFVVDCGETDPEGDSIEWCVILDWAERRLPFSKGCGTLTAVCCRIVAADEGVPCDMEDLGVLKPDGGVKWPGLSTP